MKICYHVLPVVLVLSMIFAALGGQENTTDFIELQGDSDLADVILSQPINDIDVTLWMARLNDTATAYFHRADGREYTFPAKHMIYNIGLLNSGSGKLTDVVLFVDLDKGIKYARSKHMDSERGYLEEYAIDPEAPNEDFDTNVSWQLDTMNSGEMIFILLEAYVKEGIDEKGIRAEVKGKTKDGNIVESSGSSPSDQCYLRYVRGEEEQIGTVCYNPNNPDCGIECPDWAKPL